MGYDKQRRPVIEALESFSTSEHALAGVSWIDGKQVYRKVVELGALPNATTKSVAHGIASLGTIISLTGSASNVAGSRWPLPNVSTLALNSGIALSADATNVDVTTGIDRSSLTGYAVLLYTKA